MFSVTDMKSFLGTTRASINRDFMSPAACSAEIEVIISIFDIQ